MITLQIFCTLNMESSTLATKKENVEGVSKYSVRSSGLCSESFSRHNPSWCTNSIPRTMDANTPRNFSFQRTVSSKNHNCEICLELNIHFRTLKIVNYFWKVLPLLDANLYRHVVLWKFSSEHKCGNFLQFCARASSWHTLVGGGKEHMSTPGHPGNGLGCLNCFFGSSVEQGGLVRVEFT